MPQLASKSFWRRPRLQERVRFHERLLAGGLLVIAVVVTFSNDSNSETPKARPAAAAAIRGTLTPAETERTRSIAAVGGSARVGVQAFDLARIDPASFEDDSRLVSTIDNRLSQSR